MDLLTGFLHYYTQQLRRVWVPVLLVAMLGWLPLDLAQSAAIFIWFQESWSAYAIILFVYLVPGTIPVALTLAILREDEAVLAGQAPRLRLREILACVLVEVLPLALTRLLGWCFFGLVTLLLAFLTTALFYDGLGFGYRGGLGYYVDFWDALAVIATLLAMFGPGAYFLVHGCLMETAHMADRQRIFHALHRSLTLTRGRRDFWAAYRIHLCGTMLMVAFILPTYVGLFIYFEQVGGDPEELWWFIALVGFPAYILVTLLTVAQFCLYRFLQARRESPDPGHFHPAAMAARFDAPLPADTDL